MSAHRKMRVQLPLTCQGSVTTGGRFDSGEGAKALDGFGEPMGTAGTADKAQAESCAGAFSLNGRAGE